VPSIVIGLTTPSSVWSMGSRYVVLDIALGIVKINIIAANAGK
jgi:hypothetical protein